MSHRKEQVESALKRAIAAVLDRHLHDPRIAGLVSITRIELSDDRHQAAVHVSVMPEQFERRTLHGLNAAAGYIQSKVARAVRMRIMPGLVFRLDSSIKKEAQVLNVIQEAMAEDRLAAEQRGDVPETEAEAPPSPSSDCSDQEAST